MVGLLWPVLRKAYILYKVLKRDNQKLEAE